MTEKPASKPTKVALGHQWAVPAASSATVLFVSPSGREHVVHTGPDGHGERAAVLVMTESGDWIARVSNGDEHTARVQWQHPENRKK